MPTPAAQLSEDGRYPPHPPEKYHHTPSTLKSRVPSNTFRKGCDDDATAARISPRVSPIREGPTTTTGAARPVADEPPGISLAPKPTPTQTSESALPNMPPTSLCHHTYHTNFTVSLRPPTRGLEGGRGHTGLGGNHNTAGRRGQPPPRRGSDRTCDMDLQGLHTPVQTPTDPDNPCSHAAARRPPEPSPPAPQPSRHHHQGAAPPSPEPPARPSPDGPERGPDLAPQPTATPLHQGRPRPADPAAEPHRRLPSSTTAGRREPRLHLLGSGEGTSAGAGAIRATPMASAGGGEGEVRGKVKRRGRMVEALRRLGGRRERYR
ncbi:hypothetical protein VPH35_092015 [Triticum aestivum]